MPQPVAYSDLDLASEGDLVGLAQSGHADAVRVLVRRHNQRLYRVARSILRDDSEAEDVVQETYVRAFTSLSEFRQESSLATWLTRIALNEALGRLRRRRDMVELETLDTTERDRAQIIPFPLIKPDDNPEFSAARQQVRRLIEAAIDKLPEPFRIVFILRDIEELSIEETAVQLGLRSETVRTRLHRAHALLRKTLDAQVASALEDVFAFAGQRCERAAEAVIRRLTILQPE